MPRGLQGHSRAKPSPRPGAPSDGIGCAQFSRTSRTRSTRFSDLTHAEIAEHLCLPLGTVKGRMQLGLKKLRNHPEGRAMADLEPPPS